MLNSTSLFDFLKPQSGLITPTLPSQNIEESIKAISIIQNAINSNRKLNRDEKKLISNFSGWGRHSKAFDTSHPKHLVLKNAFLQNDNYRSAARSILTGFYTPPALIQTMYRAVERLGYSSSGKIIEPSCGTGRFISHAPNSINRSKITGIELDTLSGHMARELNPTSKILLNQPFEKVSLSDSGNYSLAISNVPFSANQALDHRFGPLNLHSYFIARMISELHVGGLCAVLVSSWFLDSLSKKGRQAVLDQNAELVAAVRLPSDTFKTDAINVTTDILIFRKQKSSNSNPNWLNTAIFTDEKGATGCINEYFISHPEKVAGHISAPSNEFDRRSCHVTAFENDKDSIKRILDTQTQKPLFTIDKKAVAGVALIKHLSKPIESMHFGQFEYGLINDNIYHREADSINDNGNKEAKLILVETSEKKANKLKRFISLKNALKALLDAESQAINLNDQNINQRRSDLNQNYDQFVLHHGAMHTRTNKLALCRDPYYFRLRALEVAYRPENKTTNSPETWQKAPIFKTRILTPYLKPAHAVNIEDAISISITECGSISLSRCSELLTVSTKTIETMLIESKLAFRDHTAPHCDTWILASHYLGGEVTTKLRLVESVINEHPELIPNRIALKAVQPLPVEAIDITTPIFAHWLTGDIREQFISHLLGVNSDPSVVLANGRFYVNICSYKIPDAVLCDK